MPRIYLADLSSHSQNISLPAKQAQHIKVLRLQANDEITLFNGLGLNATAKIGQVDKKTVIVEILTLDTMTRPAVFPIHLAQSFIKNEHMDWLIQKAVELGVAAITPVVSERCQGRLKPEQLERKLQHWQDIIIAACEQCGLNFLPTLYSPCSFNIFVKAEEKEATGIKFILNPHVSRTLKNLPAEGHAAATILVGPEGGFTENEISMAQQERFIALSLHPQILRAETAAITATGIIQFYFNRN